MGITDDPTDPRLGHGIDPAGGHEQNGTYLVLSADERARGFVRPVRNSYTHQACGTLTRMGIDIAETYATRPGFYGATFCVGCGGHFAVGAEGEFIWPDGTKVGT